MGELLERSELMCAEEFDLLDNSIIVHPENKKLAMAIDDIEGKVFRRLGTNAFGEYLYYETTI